MWLSPVPGFELLSGFPVSASFDGKQHLRSLPVVNSIGYVLRFLAKLCRSLLCDDLFSHQPFPRRSSASEEAQENQEGRMETGRLCPSVFPLPAGCLRDTCPPGSAEAAAEETAITPRSSPAGGPRAASLEALGVIRASQDQGYLNGPHPGCSGKRSLHYSL